MIISKTIITILIVTAINTVREIEGIDNNNKKNNNYKGTKPNVLILFADTVIWSKTKSWDKIFVANENINNVKENFFKMDILPPRYLWL